MKRFTARHPITLATFASLAFALVPSPASAQKAEHVVVLVWDGLRPDTVTEQDTPTLYKLAHGGTNFANHHSIYPSSTEVNGTALSTGSYPQHSGLMSNREYRPDIELLKPINTEESEAVRKGDDLTRGKFLAMPTIAEIVRFNGKRSVVAGTKPVALLLDRGQREGAIDKASVDMAHGRILPANAQGDLDQFPVHFPTTAEATKSANARQDEWTTRVLIEKLWHGEVPAFTTLWLSEPDFAQHGSGPGSEVAKSALKSDDDNLARVLAALDAAHVRDKTDVLIVSDHGFSTISRTVKIARELKEAGFDAAEKFTSEPKNGQIMVVTNGGSASFYVIGHDADVVHRLLDWLQASDFAGVLFTKQPAEGTFTLDQAKIDTAGAPDVVVSMRWTSEKSGTGLPGMLIGSATKYGPGQGYHASLSPYDMHNTLIAAGPDFHAGFTDDFPSGNADVAPTVLWLLGMKDDAAKMDGRILGEALEGGPAAADHPVTTTLHANRSVGSKTWEQSLRITTMGSRVYLDQGNGNVAGTEAKKD